jgi:outer membrane protein assembly factor BamB
MAMGLVAAVASLPAVTAQDPPVVAQGKARAVARPVAPPGVPADPDSSKEAESAADSVHLPTNHDARRLLGVAKDYISEEDWGQAANVLQALIDLPEDAFSEVKHKGADGKEKTRWISVREEANHLLGTMPAQGLEFYELRYGGKARALLNRAKDQNDPSLLAEVAFKYRHTYAGLDATELLGTYHLDRGRYDPAAICFERLLRRQGNQAAALTLFKACLAFQRADDRKNYESNFATAWKLLTTKARDGLEVGDERVPLDRLHKVLVAKTPATRQTAKYDWLIFRGDAKRNAQGKGGTLFREPRWTISLVPAEFREVKEGKAWVEAYLHRALKTFDERGQAALPGFFPIAAGGKLVFRSYGGVHAVHPKKDSDQLEWFAALRGALEALAADTEKKVELQNWYENYANAGPQNVLFANSMVGTLSCDNARVYVVDDLALPPHPQRMQNVAMGGGQPPLGRMQELVNHSILQAFDLESGKLIWERGTSDKDDLAGTYFLGPPLPLGGKLYALNEKAQELRLLCLEATRGDTVWSQTLATARDRILLDIGRRINAAHLAYADGILVCPTNAGAVLGVDLLTHSLIWAYPYREGPPPMAQLEMGGGRRVIRGGMMVPAQPMNLSPETWQGCTPIIHEGKIVLAAPDGGSLRCLTLREGAEVWRANRENDLYVGGVFTTQKGSIAFVVGKGRCRALDLATGKQLWYLETGLPSGHGVAGDNKYYLPIKSDPQDTETPRRPAIVVIDLDQGKDEAHTMARSKDAVFGNLLFYEGDVISQTVTEISAFPQMDVKLALIDKSLAKDPKNPVGLIERGELRLDKGELQGALDDLRTALANKPPPDLVPKARAKLFEVFAKRFKDDFTANEQYLKEFEALCTVEASPDALPEEKLRAQEEQRIRRNRVLFLVADGREKQGKLLEAFQAYQEFGAQAGGGKELIPVPDDQTVKARADVWAQGRIAAMIARASPAQRKPLEAKIAAEWQAVKATNDPAAIRRFVVVFGALFQAGKEARLFLAERLMQDDNKENFLEAELQLQQLRQVKDDPATVGRAVEALARLMIKKGLLEDAAYYYRELGRDFANVPVRDGKTGGDFYNELVTDKRFLPYLGGGTRPWKGVRLKGDRQNPYRGRFGMQPVYTFLAQGDVTPYFERFHFTLEQNGFLLKLVDQDTGREVWRSPQLTPAYYLFQGFPNLRLTYQARGHLVVMTLGTTVYGFDPVDHRKLWEYPLTGNLGTPEAGGLPPGTQVTPDNDGNLRLVYATGDFQRLGQAGPVEAAYVCLQTRDGLVAVDPLTGRPLWTRSDVATRSQVFGDGQYVFLADFDAGGNVTGTRALRAHDGVAVDLAKFAEPFKHKGRVLGRHLFWVEQEAANLVAHIYDLTAAKDIWKKSFPPGSKIVQSEEPVLAAIADPEGTVTLVDLAAARETLQVKMAPEDVKNATAIHLVADRDLLYLAVHEPPDGQKVAGGPWPNATHMRAVPVNGMLYVYDRATGKLRWDSDGKIDHQLLLLEQFNDLPVVILTAQYQKANAQGGNPANRWMGILAFDKQTGKAVLDKEEPTNGIQFFQLAADIERKSIELVSVELKFRLVQEGEASTRKGGGGEAADSRPPAPPVPFELRKEIGLPPPPVAPAPPPVRKPVRR